MKANDLTDIYEWGIRSGIYNRDPKELIAPWYTCDERQEYEYGRIKGKRIALEMLVTGELSHRIKGRHDI